MDRLVYFAASVFWRTTVHDWEGANRIELTIEEELRKYLLDEGPWPANAVLLADFRSSPEMRKAIEKAQVIGDLR